MEHYLQRLVKASFIVFNLMRVCDCFTSSSSRLFSQTIQYRHHHHHLAKLSSSSSSSLCMLQVPDDMTTMATMNTLTAMNLIIDQSTSTSSSTFLIAETEEWRQYVLLFVSLGVLLDILLGSPLANLALAPMRRVAESSDNEEGGTDSGSDGMGAGGSVMNTKKTFLRNPRERVDSEAVGEAALQKARYSMELRQFLEENKTDEQRYEEMRKKIDAEAAAFDSRKKEL